MDKVLFERIKSFIPESIQPALFGEPISDNISHDDWAAASKYLQHNYGGMWDPVAVRSLTPWEYLCTEEVTVVESQYGMSAEFKMKTGSTSYIPLYCNADFTLGEKLVPQDLKLISLYREGGPIIHRVTNQGDFSDLLSDVNLGIEELASWIATKQRIWDTYLRDLRDAQYEREGINTKSIFFNLRLY